MVLALAAALLFHVVPAAETHPVTVDAAPITLTARPNFNTTKNVAPSFKLTASAGPSTELMSNPLNAAPLAAGTQNTQVLSTIRVPQIRAGKPVRFVAAEDTPSRRNWLLLSFVQHGAAAFDAYATRQAIATGAREDDPFMRPFAHTPAIYFANQAGPLLLDFAARRMQRSRNPLLRRTWWLAQSASTGFFLLSGVHNLHVATHNP
jgi:hypothetical protein